MCPVPLFGRASSGNNPFMDPEIAAGREVAWLLASPVHQRPPRPRASRTDTACDHRSNRLAEQLGMERAEFIRRAQVARLPRRERALRSSSCGTAQLDHRPDEAPESSSMAAPARLADAFPLLKLEHYECGRPLADLEAHHELLR